MEESKAKKEIQFKSLDLAERKPQKEFQEIEQMKLRDI